MKVKAFLITALLAAGFAKPGQAQVVEQFALQNSPAYEAAANPLRDAPPRDYDFSKALLSDVLRFLAADAGISFLGLPDGTESADRLVTFSLRTSPFTALETLAKANGIALIHEKGLWYLRPANDTELIGRVYQINYNSQETVTKNNQAAGQGIGSGNGYGNNSASNLSLQGAPDTFTREPSKLIEDVRAILDLPTTGGLATIAPAASVDTFSQFATNPLASTANPLGPATVAGAARAAGRNDDDDSPKARVIWNSDANSLYVVATRQQHQWIEGYLAAADQPQSVIALEMKFFELSKDPRTEFGLDWTGTLEGGYGATLGGIENTIDLNRGGDWRPPTSAILSFEDVNVRLRALLDDRNTKTTSFPRMLTLDNREVVFRSVINQPVLASSASTSLGAGATQTSAVDYLPIGTVINVLPKKMAENSVLLNISVTVSDIIGTEIIDGNPFPIASSRVYTAPIQVESGYTVAISGLDQAIDDKIDQGFPVLSKIPVLGYAFKYRQNRNERKHLMMFITPTVIRAEDGGVTEQPATRHAKGPVSYTPTPPVAPRHVDFNRGGSNIGELPGGDADLDVAPLLVPDPPEIMETSVLIPRRDGAPRQPRFKLSYNPKKDQKDAATGHAATAPAEPAPMANAAPAAPDLSPEAKRRKQEEFMEKYPLSTPVTPEADPTEPKTEPLPAAPNLDEIDIADTTGDPDQDVTTTGDEIPAHLLVSQPVTGATVPPKAKEVEEEGEAGAVRAKPLSSPDIAGLMANTGKTPPQEPETYPIAWEDGELKGGATAVPEAVDFLDRELNALAEAGAPDKARLTQVTTESDKLLKYIDRYHASDQAQFRTLNDQWWSLVKINGRSKKLNGTLP